MKKRTLPWNFLFTGSISQPQTQTLQHSFHQIPPSLQYITSQAQGNRKPTAHITWVPPFAPSQLLQITSNVVKFSSEKLYWSLKCQSQHFCLIALSLGLSKGVRLSKHPLGRPPRRNSVQVNYFATLQLLSSKLVLNLGGILTIKT